MDREQPLFPEDPFKELASVVLESALRCYREPTEHFPKMTREELSLFCWSPLCRLYEEILEWQPSTFARHLKEAGIKIEKPPLNTRGEQRKIHTFKRTLPS